MAAGPSTAQCRGPVSSRHVMALAPGVASEKPESRPTQGAGAAPTGGAVI